MAWSTLMELYDPKYGLPFTEEEEASRGVSIKSGAIKIKQMLKSDNLFWSFLKNSANIILKWIDTKAEIWKITIWRKASRAKCRPHYCNKRFFISNGLLCEYFFESMTFGWSDFLVLRNCVLNFCFIFSLDWTLIPKSVKIHLSDSTFFSKFLTTIVSNLILSRV